MIASIALGLASRRYKGLFPAVLENYPGDALWALVVFQCIAFAKPLISRLFLAFITLAIAFLVEFSQLYQAEWINDIRQTLPGHLLLGSSFVWQDLCAYTVGVVMGVMIDMLIHQMKLKY